MKLAPWLSLVLIAGCLTRTDVGSLRPLPAADAGTIADADSSLLPTADASLTPEERATRAFEREIEGRWAGFMRTGTFRFDTQFVFGPDNACCIGNPPCSEGRYFITDKLSNGNFAGKIEPADGTSYFRLDTIVLDPKSDPETLQFRLSGSGFNVFDVRLTRVE